MTNAILTKRQCSTSHRTSLRRPRITGRHRPRGPGRSARPTPPTDSSVSSHYFSRNMTRQESTSRGAASARPAVGWAPTCAAPVLHPTRTGCHNLRQRPHRDRSVSHDTGMRRSAIARCRSPFAPTAASRHRPISLQCTTFVTRSECPWDVGPSWSCCLKPLWQHG